MADLNNIPHPIIFFDGVCNLCTGVVQYVIRHDPKRRFRFASLQSEVGQQLLKQYNLPSEEFGSFILFEKGKVYTKSTAALTVAKNLNGLLPIWYTWIILPKFIRDAVYNLVARNRYKWFGKKEECWIPTPELNGLFIN
ncbi:MAG: thiol-disulfide oxidoreductase DCC family protein [Bacteroidota bacterium]